MTIQLNPNQEATPTHGLGVTCGACQASTAAGLPPTCALTLNLTLTQVTLTLTLYLNSVRCFLHALQQPTHRVAGEYLGWCEMMSPAT